MSALLNEVLADLKAKRISYEDFLRRMGDVAKAVQTGRADATPEALKESPALRALYNNLKAHSAGFDGEAGVAAEDSETYKFSGDPLLNLAVLIDKTVREVRPDSFRGNKAKESVIKQALFPLLGGNKAEVERIFLIISAQPEY